MPSPPARRVDAVPGATLPLATLTISTPIDPRELAGTLDQAAAIAARCHASAAAIDVDGAFPTREFGWLAEAGLLAAPLRRDLGGLGMGSEPGGTGPLLQLLKRIGRGNLAVGRLYEGHVNALLLIQAFGTPEQVEGYAADARAGLRFAVWNTEGADGIRFEPLGSGRWRMLGAKTFASGAGSVERPIVPGALPDGGWQMVVVASERAEEAVIDADSWHPLGMRASASTRVDYPGVELEPGDLLGGAGDYRREPAFSGGAIRFAAVQLGGAEALFEATRTHLRRTGRADDPYQKARLGEMAIAVEAGNLWLDGAARSAEDPASEPGGGRRLRQHGPHGDRLDLRGPSSAWPSGRSGPRGCSGRTRSSGSAAT